MTIKSYAPTTKNTPYGLIPYGNTEALNARRNVEWNVAYPSLLRHQKCCDTSYITIKQCKILHSNSLV